jgi:hypothetical protein
MLILCWDIIGFIWGLDLLSISIRLGAYELGSRRETLHAQEAGEELTSGDVK